MTKINFSKTILRTLGIICLLLSSMCLYGGISYGIQIGIAGVELFLIGLANLLFLSPAIKGFAEN